WASELSRPADAGANDRAFHLHRHWTPCRAARLLLGAQNQGSPWRHHLGHDREGVQRSEADPRSPVARNGEGWRAELCDGPSGSRLGELQTMNLTAKMRA